MIDASRHEVIGFKYRKSKMNEVFLIGEIGINHNGDLNIAKQLIDIASDCGFDAVKFQKRNIDIVYSQEYLDSNRISPWGTTQRDQKAGLEFSLSDYLEIDKYCKQKGICWFVSCWDMESQVEMRIFETQYNKIASAMATNLEFCKLVAEEMKYTYISTGMMNLEQIDRVVDIFNSAGCEYMLMHTVSTYPAEESELNLLCIKMLSERYCKPVGYSGHESGVSPSVMAAVLGAQAVERHITLDRAMYGSDQAASLEPAGMRALVNSVRKVKHCLGDGVKRVIDKEVEVAKKLRYWQAI